MAKPAQVKVKKLRSGKLQYRLRGKVISTRQARKLLFTVRDKATMIHNETGEILSRKTATAKALHQVESREEEGLRPSGLFLEQFGSYEDWTWHRGTWGQLHAKVQFIFIAGYTTFLGPSKSSYGLASLQEKPEYVVFERTFRAAYMYIPIHTRQLLVAVENAIEPMIEEYREMSGYVSHSIIEVMYLRDRDYET